MAAPGDPERAAGPAVWLRANVVVGASNPSVHVAIGQTWGVGPRMTCILCVPQDGSTTRRSKVDLEPKMA